VSEIAHKPLRIALFTGNYNYINDGVALTLNRLVAYLQRNNIPVLIFAPTAKEAAFESVGEVVSIPSFAFPFRTEYRVATGLSKAALQRLKAFQPTLIHVATPDIAGFQALRQAELMKVPVVATFHTRYETYLKFYGFGFLEKFVLRYYRKFYARCQMVFPPSQSMLESLQADGISAPMEVFGRGVDSELFSPVRRSLPWRQSLGILDDDIVVGFVSRLVKEKNTDLMRDCFYRLQAAGLKFKILIVGDGPEEKSLKLNLPNAIFTGKLSGEDLARAYASFDIFFFPSESETFGNVTLEAMASGVPAIVADATGSKSIVVHGESGYIQTAREPLGFDVLISRLIKYPKLRTEMGEAARVHALEFNWDKILAMLVKRFEDISQRRISSP
jgi:phosphatidylinositol alpha 1,6-mannosyltransferase